MSEVKPYQELSEGKKEQVRIMFNNISRRYDFLNHFLSLGIDKSWRKLAVGMLRENHPKKILDVATGTGDFALESLVLNPDSITGIDISEKMLEQGRQKIKNKGLDKIIRLETGDSENLTFPDNTFDAITVGFGVRNFENLAKGMSEMFRVLNKNGKLVVLEFSKPKTFPVKQFYNLYFTHILPFIGSVVSSDKRAYRYLNESVNAFPEGNDFLQIMRDTGFREVSQKRLMKGIASIYVGKK